MPLDEELENADDPCTGPKTTVEVDLEAIDRFVVRTHEAFYHDMDELDQEWVSTVYYHLRECPYHETYAEYRLDKARRLGEFTPDETTLFEKNRTGLDYLYRKRR